MVLNENSTGVVGSMKTMKTLGSMYDQRSQIFITCRSTFGTKAS